MPGEKPYLLEKAFTLCVKNGWHFVIAGCHTGSELQQTAACLNFAIAITGAAILLP